MEDTGTFLRKGLWAAMLAAQGTDVADAALSLAGSTFPPYFMTLDLNKYNGCLQCSRVFYGMGNDTGQQRFPIRLMPTASWQFWLREPLESGQL